MIIRKRPPITTITELLESLYIEPMSRDRRYLARLQYLPPEIEVIEFYDDGGGHSNAFTQETTPVSKELFLEARQERYITGVLEPGYVSSWRFKLSETGREGLFALRKEAQKAATLT